MFENMHFIAMVRQGGLAYEHPDKAFEELIYSIAAKFENSTKGRI